MHTIFKTYTMERERTDRMAASSGKRGETEEEKEREMREVGKGRGRGGRDGEKGRERERGTSLLKGRQNTE